MTGVSRRVGVVSQGEVLVVEKLRVFFAVLGRAGPGPPPSPEPSREPPWGPPWEPSRSPQEPPWDVPGAAFFVFAVDGLCLHVVLAGHAAQGLHRLADSARLAARAGQHAQLVARVVHAVVVSSYASALLGARARPCPAASCSPSCGPAGLQHFGSPRGARRPGRLRQHFRLLLARCWAEALRAESAAPYSSTTQSLMGVLMSR